MKILSHRGYWDNLDERNSKHAFQKSFLNNFGTETDIRDFNGELVISHDIASIKSIKIDDFLTDYIQTNPNLPLALNIKSDGLNLLLKSKLDEYKIVNYFVFDMSVPDMLQYIKSGLKTFCRLSEFETEPILLDNVSGIWLDRFYSNDYPLDQINKYIDLGKIVCIVSPELHKREHKDLWIKIKDMDTLNSNLLYLCTDLPIEAKEFFGGNEND